MKKIFLLLVIFLTACGYQPLFNVEKNNLFFRDIELSGNKKINRKIISSLKIKENQREDSTITIIIDSDKTIIETSKDSRGQAETYRTSIIIKLTIKNLEKVVKANTFEESFSYDNRDNKYDLLNYQNEIENNLVNKMIEDIILFINL